MTFTQAKAKLPSWAKGLSKRAGVNDVPSLIAAVKGEISLYFNGMNPLTAKQFSDLEKFLNKM